MEYIGLIFEFVFLGLAIYMYLFARGKITTKDPALRQKAEAFREQNGGWLRILSLALMAIMSVNIVLHIADLLK